MNIEISMDESFTHFWGDLSTTIKHEWPVQTTPLPIIEIFDPIANANPVPSPAIIYRNRRIKID